MDYIKLAKQFDGIRTCNDERIRGFQVVLNRVGRNPVREEFVSGHTKESLRKILILRNETYMELKTIAAKYLIRHAVGGINKVWDLRRKNPNKMALLSIQVRNLRTRQPRQKKILIDNYVSESDAMVAANTIMEQNSGFYNRVVDLYNEGTIQSGLALAESEADNLVPRMGALQLTRDERWECAFNELSVGSLVGPYSPPGT